MANVNGGLHDAPRDWLLAKLTGLLDCLAKPYDGTTEHERVIQDRAKQERESHDTYQQCSERRARDEKHKANEAQHNPDNEELNERHDGLLKT
jgi:hypothetical protein